DSSVGCRSPIARIESADPDAISHSMGSSQWPRAGAARHHRRRGIGATNDGPRSCCGVERAASPGERCTPGPGGCPADCRPVRGDLAAASALLQAAGSSRRVVVTADLSLDAAAVRSTGAIRAAVIRALENDERTGSYVMRVGLNEDGGLRVVVASDARQQIDS